MKIVIFGSGILAELCHHYFTHDSEFEVAGFCVDPAYLHADSFLQLPVVSFEDVEKRFSPREHAMFVAVGYTGVNTVREQKCLEARQKGYQLASYVSSSAINHAGRIGDNSFILEKAVLQPFVELGDGVIVWAGTVVSHHSMIDDYCYLSPGITVAGSVRMGKRCFAGAGVVIRDGVSIADDAVLGMGAVVLRDLTGQGVYKGVPARFSHLLDDASVI